jgi:acetate---CoA ligase (ADP-forming)
MSLLAGHGIDVAPHLVVSGPGEIDQDAAASLGSALVIKLADVPHRADLGAVRVNVTAGQLRAAAEDLSVVAARHGLPGRLVIQPVVAGESEAFIGVRNDTDLGPVIVAGLGGSLVESAGLVVGRLLPADRTDVAAMLDELDQRLTARLGRPPRWNKEGLAAAAAGLAELAMRAPWLASVDVNPLICGGPDCTAVDVLMVCVPDDQEPQPTA